MEQRTDRLYPSAPLEKPDLEQRLGRKINDVISFKSSVNNIKEIIACFKDEKQIEKEI